MRSLIAGSAALPLVFAGAPASAQDAGNEVWIGQTGNTNTIVIVQEGEGNRAGADNVRFLMNQDGDFNVLSIDQFGWNNHGGRTEVGEDRPSGINQVGDRNEILVEQITTEPSGSNEIGAVYQQSSRLSGSPANLARIRQSEDGAATLGAGHFLGSVRQINDSENGAANEATIEQSGGGVGLSHSIASVSQSGTGNTLDIWQTDQSNAMKAIVQRGEGNFLHSEQGNGQDNLVEFTEQFGALNSMKIRQSGSRNVIQQALQNNEILETGTGNRIDVAMTGEDNGGDGRGGVGEFLATATLGLSGVAQGVFLQMGDDNDLALTIVQGALSKFGFTQIGDGNGIVSAISEALGQAAYRNEVGVFQQGDDNYIAHSAIGSDNVLAVTQVGGRNLADVQQTGQFHTTMLRIDGYDTNSASAGGFSGDGLTGAAGAGLSPGTIVQKGTLHSVSLVVGGSRNLFGVSQTGDTHRIDSTMSGSNNQFVAVQTGIGNTSLSQQYGSGNGLLVRQY
ncbi:hypothetical protein KEU06_23005 [Pseudaminobacter sp. 19-2017]|uniref:Curlin associated repeat-containing protein n=1 Tax=Pseudaminobacter soli (ex Zhang et al. 2022) TaxID=2831468 RepID=A0A942E5C8_9HYPH|nr:hypothetical protein [Pseudaminobacter soli]MBS3651490.1 hypothetical protein [Pseudaminobacter soli]